jgi:hypothetical protein
MRLRGEALPTLICSGVGTTGPRAEDPDAVRRGGDAPLAGSMHNGGGYFLVGIYVNLEVYSIARVGTSRVVPGAGRALLRGPRANVARRSRAPRPGIRAAGARPGVLVS